MYCLGSFGRDGCYEANLGGRALLGSPTSPILYPLGCFTYADYCFDNKNHKDFLSTDLFSFLELACRYTYRVIALASMLEHSLTLLSMVGFPPDPRTWQCFLLILWASLGARPKTIWDGLPNWLIKFMLTCYWWVYSCFLYNPQIGFFCYVMPLSQGTVPSTRAIQARQWGRRLKDFAGVWLRHFPSCAVQAGHAPFCQVAA